VINPVSDDQDALRTTLLPSLLEVAARNRNYGRLAVLVFELARAYLRRSVERGGQPDRSPAEQPDELIRLAVVRSGLPSAEAGRVAFLELKGALERAVDSLAPVEVAYEQAAATMFHPGRCAAVVVCGQRVGHIGELHPDVTREFDLEGRAVALEIEMAPILALDIPRRAKPLPRFPAINRDLAVVVAESVAAGELLRTIRESGGSLLESATAFDEYRGSQVPVGSKSLAFSMVFRSPERTLTDAEVDAQLDVIRSALRARHQATFRV
jgi:phenylalanyl-tRNA synthetase beta chain